MKTLCTTLLILFSLNYNLYLNAQCSTPVVIEQGVECKLPKIISNNELLLPCIDSFMITNAPLGTKFLISFIPSSCFSVCQQGTMVEITCATLLTSTTDLNNSPISMYVDVTSQNLMIEATGINSIVILDLSGKTYINRNSGNLNSLDISNLSAGIYIARVSSNKGISIIKFIK